MIRGGSSAAVALLAVSLVACAGGAPPPEDSDPLMPPAAVDRVEEPYSPRPDGSLTFTRDVAPIVYRHCSPCHRPGESAPFPLVDYADVRARASQIARVTGDRYMPPWLPEPGYGEFVGRRALSAEQIGLLAQWVREGAVEGDPADLPAVSEWTPGWQLGEPDLVIETAEPYRLGADGPDVFWNLVYRQPSGAERWVRGFELRPGNPRVLHHATLKIDRTHAARRLDDEQPGPGYGGMHTEGTVNPDGHFLGWVPGRVPLLTPESTAWTLGAETDLVLELHMFPSGRVEPVAPKIGLFFADEPPRAAPFMIRLGSRTMEIPAGEADYRVRESYRLPVDVEVLSVVPHAHYLGRQVLAWATLPDGSKRWLIRIDDWNFNWQDEFRLVRPMPLPAGTVLAMEFSFDNSEDNVRNPYYPPRRVLYGPRTTDEMGDLWIQVLPTPTRYATLLDDYRRFDRERLIAQHEWRVRMEPADPQRRNGLGHQYAQAGRTEEAREQFLEAIRLDPSYAYAHRNLGSLAHRAARLDEAARHYTRALELEPHATEVRVLLARVRVNQGRLDEALVELRRAAADDPDSASTHLDLARLFELAGAPREALAHYRRSSELAAEPAVPLTYAALLLATHPDDAVRDGAAALGLALRARELTGPDNPLVLETLAAAHAASGEFDLAVTTARRALQHLAGPQAAATAERIRVELEHYGSGLPFTRDPRAAPALARAR